MPKIFRQIFLNATINFGDRSAEDLQPAMRINFNWPIINRDSVVLVTASECHFNQETGTFTRFVGDARLWVADVAPHGPPETHDGGVTFYLMTDWEFNTPINVAVDITVFDDLPVGISVENLQN